MGTLADPPSISAACSPPAGTAVGRVAGGSKIVSIRPFWQLRRLLKNFEKN
jgi:hypothetical protein